MIEKQVFRNISYGMYLVTTKGDKNGGCIINTLSQVTSENPLVTISLNKNNYTSELVKLNKRFAVSIISEETDNNIITTFGYQTGKTINKFENIAYNEISDLPVVTDKMSAYLICEVVNIVDAETHYIFISRVVEAKMLNDLTPMTYKYYHDVRKGTSPKNAPTFVEEEKIDGYRCPICGYVYDNSKESIKFEELPEDWVCPICMAPKNKFVKLN